MQKQKYIGTNPLLWLVLIVLAFVVVSQYRDAKAEETQAKQGYVQTSTDEVR